MKNHDYSRSNLLSFPFNNNKTNEVNAFPDDLATIFSNSFQENPLPMIIVNRDLTIIAVNTACVNTYKIKKDQSLKNDDCLESLGSAFKEQLLQLHEKQLISPNVLPNCYHFNIIDDSGCKKTLAIHKNFINSFQDSVISIVDVSAYNDTTNINPITNDLVHMEDLKVASELAASVGHEIRNPMTAVRGFIQRLSQKTDFSNYQSYFSIILEELDRANQIITEYLALTKVKTDTVKPENLNTIINKLFPLLQINAVSTNKSLLLDLEPLPDISVNPKEIRQLLLNLVKNGIESMETGKSLTIKTYQHDNGDINLAIQDEGCGIPDAVLAKIGTPYFTTKPTGTGLGLSICYNIAKKNNATIHIDSSDKGSTFTICFHTNEC